MNRRQAIARLALAAAATLPLANAAQAQSNEIAFGFISTESSSNLKSAWQPVLDDLARATGLTVKPFFATDYAGVIEAMRFNKVQVGWFGNKSAIEAVDRAQGEVFAKVVGKDGNEGYYSLLIVQKDSPLKSLDDVVKQRAGLTLGYGDPNSTSGTVIPGYFAFGMAGVDPLKDFKRTVRANHETNLLAVVNRQVDVATNNTENWDRFALTHPEQMKSVREIWRSPMIPSDPLVWRRDLDDATKKKLRDFFLAYGKQPREAENLAAVGYSGFRASSDLQLVAIRQIELAKKRSTVEQDAALSADERARQLRDIDAKLAELNKQIASK
ncbi:phosphonate ABC transporter substrate-binding protein [Derxia lacustris]|uniref:phosphonate ABC transporter substrate-binding protein n=1 Tax=Derxia lacustris TaxID=764842 RepID=UPI000A1727C8|nr:phosphonate ABC transporter substrate-binding protein [Derxia lacustris]